MSQWVHGLRFDNIRGDIYGGVTAAIVALPLALGMGVTSGAGPVAGMYGAIFVGLFAALFGGTPAQVSGPTGPMTVVMAAIFTQYVAIDPVTGPAMAFTVVILGGLFQLLFGVFKLGKYIALVPFPVISGFMSGIGVIIILLQLGPLLGHASPAKPLEAVQSMPAFFADINTYALILGAMTMGIVYMLPASVSRIVPAPLVALIAGTMTLMYLLPEGGATQLGEIPTGFPSFQMPVFELGLIFDMIQSAVILAALGSIDSLLTSLVADNKTRTHHDSDRELIGQGIGNMVAGFFGGLPGAGATMRTVVNIRAGGQTPISGALHAVILLVIVLGGGTMAGNIPHAVLAGILIKVGTDIIDWEFLKHLRTAPKSSLVVMFAVLFITVFVDLVTAVAVGVIASSMMLVQKMTAMQLSNIKIWTEPHEEDPLDEEESSIMEAAKGRILLFHLEGPFSFGAAKGMMRLMMNHDDFDVIVFDFSDVPLIDITMAKTIEDMILMHTDAGRKVLLSGLQAEVEDILKRLNILDLVGDSHVTSERIEAMRYASVLVQADLRKI